LIWCLPVKKSHTKRAPKVDEIKSGARGEPLELSMNYLLAAAVMP